MLQEHATQSAVASVERGIELETTEVHVLASQAVNVLSGNLEIVQWAGGAFTRTLRMTVGCAFIYMNGPRKRLKFLGHGNGCGGTQRRTVKR